MVAHALRKVFPHVRRLELKVRREVLTTFAGAYRSAFKGSGMEFDEVRTYQYGDDIRAIDWNVTAKSPDQVFVKVFREERQLNVFVLLDVSSSALFGPPEQNKFQAGIELTALLGFAALKHGDRFGLAAFDEHMRLYGKPTTSAKPLLGLLARIMAMNNDGRRTDLNKALEFFSRVNKRRSLLFVISDFLDDGFHARIAHLAGRHQIHLLRLFHPEERFHARMGILPVVDAESGKLRWVFSSMKRERRRLADRFAEIDADLLKLKTRYGVGYKAIDCSQDHFEALHKYMHAVTQNRSVRALA